EPIVHERSPDTAIRHQRHAAGQDLVRGRGIPRHAENDVVVPARDLSDGMTHDDDGSRRRDGEPGRVGWEIVEVGYELLAEMERSPHFHGVLATADGERLRLLTDDVRLARERD